LEKLVARHGRLMVALLLAVAALMGCASARNKYVSSVERPAGEPTLEFVVRRHQFALFGVGADGASAEPGAPSATMKVFEDGRYLGEVDPEVALAYPLCAAQPKGTALLAHRVREMATGHRDPFAHPSATAEESVEDRWCPSGAPAGIADRVATSVDRAWSNTPEAVKVGGEVAFGAFAVVTSPFWLPPLLMEGAVGAVAAGTEAGVSAMMRTTPSPIVSQQTMDPGVTDAKNVLPTGTTNVTSGLAPVDPEVDEFDGVCEF